MGAQRSGEWREQAEHHQVPIYLAAIAVGLGVGALLPRASPALELAVEPAIAALLLVTFLGIPLRGMGAAGRRHPDPRRAARHGGAGAPAAAAAHGRDETTSTAVTGNANAPPASR